MEPSEKQIRLAKTIAERCEIKLSEEALKSKKLLADFIDENKEKINTKEKKKKKKLI